MPKVSSTDLQDMRMSYYGALCQASNPHEDSDFYIDEDGELAYEDPEDTEEFRAFVEEETARLRASQESSKRD